MLPEDECCLPFDVQCHEAVPERRDPGTDPLAPSTKALPQPALHVGDRRRLVRAEVRLDRTHPRLVELGDPRPPRVAIEALERRAALLGPEAQIALPGECLEQGP